MADSAPRLVAYYLPQFHPIRENDEWWGRGFTEWTNTGKAKPLYPGHYQPHVPADLGYYDLRLPESREDQAALAREYGIEGFCYYRYWFGNGRQLLQRPWEEVVASGKPDFPFCVCWANDTWTGIWHGAPDRVLIRQEYFGQPDDEAHFESLLPAFRDRRYMCVDDKPIFVIWRPFGFPDPAATLARWRAMARAAGLPGLHLVGIYRPGGDSPEDFGYDASVHNDNPPVRPWGSWRNPMQLIYYRLLTKLGVPTVCSYRKSIDYFLPHQLPVSRYPSIVHAWDNTPRSGVKGLVLHGSTPELFRAAIQRAFALTRLRQPGHRLIFLKSWNEWAEGNHLEPDLRHGRSYLQALLEEFRSELARCEAEANGQP